jgi:hypothetical protein
VRQSFNQVVAESVLRLKQVRQHDVRKSKLSIKLVSCASAYIYTRDDTGGDQAFERLPGGRLLQPQPGCNLVAAQAAATGSAAFLQRSTREERIRERSLARRIAAAHFCGSLISRSFASLSYASSAAWRVRQTCSQVNRFSKDR